MYLSPLLVCNTTPSNSVVAKILHLQGHGSCSGFLLTALRREVAAGARTADLESGEVDSTGPGGLQGLSRWARGPAGSRRQGNKEDPYQAWDTMGSLVPEKSGTGTAPGNCSQRGKHGTQHINGTLSLGETTLLPYSLSLSPASLATGKYTTQTRDHMRGFPLYEA